MMSDGFVVVFLHALRFLIFSAERLIYCELICVLLISEEPLFLELICESLL